MSRLGFALMRATFERCFEQSAILNFARGLIHRNALKNTQWNNHKQFCTSEVYAARFQIIC